MDIGFDGAVGVGEGAARLGEVFWVGLKKGSMGKMVEAVCVIEVAMGENEGFDFGGRWREPKWVASGSLGDWRSCRWREHMRQDTGFRTADVSKPDSGWLIGAGM